MQTVQWGENWLKWQKRQHIDFVVNIASWCFFRYLLVTSWTELYCYSHTKIDLQERLPTLTYCPSYNPLYSKYCASIFWEYSTSGICICLFSVWWKQQQADSKVISRFEGETYSTNNDSALISFCIWKHPAVVSRQTLIHVIFTWQFHTDSFTP